VYTRTGLTNGTAYNFTVTATNAYGTSSPSSASNSVTPSTPSTVPGAPTIGTATAGNTQATVTFTAPGSNGGSAITGYTVTSSPGGFIATGSASPITVTGLTNGTAYNFTVTATNANGTGPASSASNSVTPSTIPTIITTTITSITATTASGGGNITSDGGATITARGVCWSTSANPTILDSKTTDGTGIGNFVSNLTGLNASSTYYVRAFATNNAGTAYGNELTFTTLNLPTITTASIYSITQNTAAGGGNITNNGGASVTAKGVCWNTSGTPTTADNKTSDGSGSDSFASSLTGLAPNTTYYVRAYATNSVGTAYGNQVSFKTTILLPTLTTDDVSSITTTTAICGGNITSEGGALVTARGICWNTVSGPTVDNAITTDGSGTGAFISSLTGLVRGVTYYVRAYATNSGGISYGNEVSFTTNIVLPTLTSLSVSAITATTASSGGYINDDGGAPVTARGVCWSISPNPTTSNSKTNDGSGTGSFVSALSGLIPEAVYYVRAYATSSVGTAYGNQVSFKTCGTVTDIDGNVYNTVTIGTQVWMKENLKTTKYNDGTAISNITVNATWTALTTGAYCDYSNTPANSTTYGRLYNWYAVDNNAATRVASNGGKNVCPNGWHVPTDAEWTTLTTYLGGESVAGGKLKETGTTHWESPNEGATNETGFTALPGGNRNNNGAFNEIGTNGFWWSSTESAAATAWYRAIYYNFSSVFRFSYYKLYGFSVRCLRD
jgi:uncharacterized protein (TIGR02145 family)